MKTIVIDDEKNGREALVTLIQRYIPEIDQVYQASNITEGLTTILAQEPDIIFLDIEMPNGSGFDLLKSEGLQHLNYHLIFTTAYEEYALEAFQYQAIHYLLKPIDLDQLRLAVNRCLKNGQSYLDYHNFFEKLKRGLFNKGKITITSRTGFEVLHTANIIYCKSEANYTQFHLMDGSKRLVSKTMKTFQQDLEQNGFFRCQKSHIVNLNFVTNYIQGKPAYLKMSNGDLLEVSRDKKQQLLQLLSSC